MGLFSETDDIIIITCPICLKHFHAPGKSAHWETHVKQIPRNATEHPGEYTWDCVCGPSNITWADKGGAAAGMGLHMQGRHNIPME
jgi:hypothetical protein